MKTLTPVLLAVSVILATTVAVPSSSSIYTLKMRAQDPKLDGSAVVVKDERSINTFPNPLGSFSTGNPRYPYSFTIASVSEKDNFFEIKSTVGQKHVILSGNPVAPQLLETPIGGDPAATPGKTITRANFFISDEVDAMYLRGGKLGEAGSWRACNQSTIDYQLYWFDGT